MSATDIRDSDSPAIARGFRLQWEPAQSAHVLLYPEGMVKLNGSAGEILRRCDGALTFNEIVADLARTFTAEPERIAADAEALLTDLANRRMVDL